MGMNEVNPDHPVTSSLHDHWYKIAAILLHRLSGTDEAVVTDEDIEAFEHVFPGDTPAILAHAQKDGLHLSIISMTRAKQLGMQ